MGESSLLLRAGMRIGQVSFQAVLGCKAQYQGAYTDQHDGPKAPVLGTKRF
jgi:deoxycytidine triphosphate deaminase